MAFFFKELLYLFLVMVSGMVRTNGNFHKSPSRSSLLFNSEMQHGLFYAGVMNLRSFHRVCQAIFPQAAH
jgi:hypothetical protein